MSFGYTNLLQLKRKHPTPSHLFCSIWLNNFIMKYNTYKTTFLNKKRLLFFMLMLLKSPIFLSLASLTTTPMDISKKGQILLFPPPALNDYLIVVSTPPEVKKETKKLNAKLNKMIGGESNHNAHISLFTQAWEQDKHLLERLKKALADVSSFPVSINGVDVFSHGTKKKTVYLKVENPKPLQQLYEACKSELKLKKDYTPHLTIEKNIPIADFEKIQNDLSLFNHQSEWICDRITVLKFNKKTNAYKQVEEILLQGGSGA